jgi:hypothetical protein
MRAEATQPEVDAGITCPSRPNCPWLELAKRCGDITDYGPHVGELIRACTSDAGQEDNPDQAYRRTGEIVDDPALCVMAVAKFTGRIGSRIV